MRTFLRYQTIVSCLMIVSFELMETFIVNSYITFPSGLVEADKIVDFRSQREKYASKGRGQSFIEAVKRMDEYLSDRKVRFEYMISLKTISH